MSVDGQIGIKPIGSNFSPQSVSNALGRYRRAHQTILEGYGKKR